MKYSACLELLFAKEAPNFADRIRLAKRAGLDGVEFWRWSNKDLVAIGDALDETGLPVAGFIAEPMVPLTDPARHTEFLEGLKTSIATARRLGAPMLIAQAGPDLPGRPRSEQRGALVACLSKAADILKGSDVVLAVEPLNTRVDHVGYFLPSTAEALDIIDEVDRREVRILYDIYHSAVMDEKIEEALDGRIDRIVHVHIADHPGRHEPGSGTMDWRSRLEWLAGTTYPGMLGLEYKPTGLTEASLKTLLER
jgi:hydroxypyruvate isomerase